MKIVIDIDKEQYLTILKDPFLNDGVYKAIKNGTPLPKHHKDIITCWDCKHYRRIELNSCDEVIATCKKHPDRNYHYLSPDFYCADGERSDK